MTNNIPAVSTTKPTSLVETFNSSSSQVQAVTATSPMGSDQVIIGEVIAPTKEAQAAAREVLGASTSSEKPSKGPIRQTKDFVRVVKKFFTDVEEYGKGIFKGLAFGSLTGLTVFAGTHAVIGTHKGLKSAGALLSSIGSNIKNMLKPAVKATEDAAADALPQVAKTAEKVAKGTSKLPTILGVISGLAVFAANMWTASLNADEKKADVDHRYTPTPVLDGK